MRSWQISAQNYFHPKRQEDKIANLVVSIFLRNKMRCSSSAFG